MTEILKSNSDRHCLFTNVPGCPWGTPETCPDFGRCNDATLPELREALAKLRDKVKEINAEFQARIERIKQDIHTDIENLNEEKP